MKSPRRVLSAWVLSAAVACAPLALALLAPAAVRAALPPDPAGTIQTLPRPPSAHWVWVNDFAFSHMVNGKAMLVDGDSGRFLGELDTGFGSMRVVLAPDGQVIYSPETYFSRGTRGERTDVVTLYDPSHLSPLGEIVIPPKRSSNMPMMSNAQLTDDGRFLLIYNFTPAQSITVVDTRSRKFVGEVETSGCALSFPTGARSFFSLCADGALLHTVLDDTGHASRSDRTEPLFDVDHDPLTEKGVRVGDTWYFVSFSGMLYPFKLEQGSLKLQQTWPLLSAAEKAQNWRPGGLQQLAVHAGLNRLYAIMHQGPLETHKDPGREVWVYDLARKARIQKIAMKNNSGSIQVTRDSHPLLFSVFIDSTVLDVYDATTGNLLRSVTDIGTTPTVLVTP
ncbi:MAG TPA: amine dehydrogenase large subunit [Steroidobacteraceae bacterium]|jgi:methylamine dehydrogenase heavy chain|nr:amine dehydrogenase large subunit [Steroidobacteraceae bacterium]